MYGGTTSTTGPSSNGCPYCGCMCNGRGTGCYGTWGWGQNQFVIVIADDLEAMAREVARHVPPKNRHTPPRHHRAPFHRQPGPAAFRKPCY